MPLKETTMPFEVPPLRYDYAALAPTIDEQTMRLHHDKHHQAYVDKLNEAVAGPVGGGVAVAASPDKYVDAGVPAPSSLNTHGD